MLNIRAPFTILFFSSLFILSCGEGSVQIPKPRAYPKITFPDRQKVESKIPDCPFAFDHMSYMTYSVDSLYFREKTINTCWFDLVMNDFNGRVHFSYYPLGAGEGNLEKLIKDAFKLSGKHNTKANYIDEIPFHVKSGVSGIIFEMEGPVASPFQFYITDSTEHFLRASLYFKTKARPDSLQPVYDFVKEDLASLIESFEWK